jgi:hypothetical protein
MLMLGHQFNNEPLTWQVVLGTAIIMTGLLLFQFGDGLIRQLRGVPQEG